VTAPILRLEEVVVRAGTRTLLDLAEFSVTAGQSVALIGPNGAGKTTLLHTAALLRQPDAGSVWIGGTQATAGNAAALRRTLSVVFQAPLLFDVRVLPNAAAGLRFQGIARAEADRRARNWLRQLGVEHLADRKARGLSGGEASRVALARAFATEPGLLLLDEPFSALDAPSRAALLPALRDRLQETGTAAVLVTHDLDEAVAFAGRLAVMAAGRLVADGSAPDLIARPPSVQVAELLGVETILPVAVRQIESDMVCLSCLPAGPSIQVQNQSSSRLFAGQVLTLTLPAGAARVLRREEYCPARANCLPGVIREVRPYTSGTRLVIETPALVVALAPWVSGTDAWSAGDRVVVKFDVSVPHLIPEEG
jgi:tungstate transport system ATP-binding protein